MSNRFLVSNDKSDYNKERTQIEILNNLQNNSVIDLSTLEASNASIQASNTSIDTNISNINTTIDDNNLKHLNTSKNNYILNEHYINHNTSKLSQIPDEKEYVGWNLHDNEISQLMTNIIPIKILSRYLVFDLILQQTTTLNNAFLYFNLQNDSVLNNTSQITLIMQLNSAFDVRVLQQRIGSTSFTDIVVSPSFNLDILDGNGISGVDISILNIKRAFRTIVDKSSGSFYFQVYSEDLNQFSTFHIFDRSTLTDKEICVSPTQIIITLSEVSSNDFYIEAFSLFLTDDIYLDVAQNNLLLDNINTKIDIIEPDIEEIRTSTIISESHLNNISQVLTDSYNPTNTTIRTDNQHPTNYIDNIYNGLQLLTNYSYKSEISESTFCTIADGDPLFNDDIDLVSDADSAGLPAYITTSNIGLTTNCPVIVEYYPTMTSTTTQVDIIQLNGHNPIALTTTFYRIVRMLFAPNTSETGNGTTYITSQTSVITLGVPDSDIFAIMNNNSRVMLMGYVYIPEGRSLIVKSINVNMNIENSTAGNLFEVQLRQYWNSDFYLKINLPANGSSEMNFNNQVPKYSTVLMYVSRVAGNRVPSMSVVFNYWFKDE